jgi:GntR family transcriptional repressor for pyruvate dehydrogenase complex
VVTQIQRLVSDGSLNPGDRLPSERELAERFQVGRSSVRDAIRILEVMGIVRPRQGEGTIVRDLSADSLIVPLATMLARKRGLVREIMEMRCMIEPALAARAAAGATPRQIAHLEDILRSQGDRVRQGELTTGEDSDFHAEIARAAGNDVVLKVLDILMDLLSQSREHALQVKGQAQRSLLGHRLVLRAIKRRDPVAAEAAMRRHIRAVEELVLKAR